MRIKTDICVIGSGSGGLSVAVGAVQMGASVVLIEKGKMGGDCLHYGCVPSKALLSTAAVAQKIRVADPLGLVPVDPKVDFEAVQKHIAGIIKAIEPKDSVRRMRKLGIKVLQGQAEFVSDKSLKVGGDQVFAKIFVVATGSTAFVPPIKGLDKVKYYTSRTIFENKKKFKHLVVLGGGPIGIEIAQAYCRLGVKVSVVEAETFMPHDDPQAVKVVIDRLRKEGVWLQDNALVREVSSKKGGVELHVDLNDRSGRVLGSDLFVATGRRPTVEGLKLEKAGVEFSPKGIQVDDRLRTTNKNIYAIGDVVGSYQFTHVANYHAGIVLRNALFWMPARVNNNIIPWVTYTDPELAQVGWTEKQAKKEGYDKLKVLKFKFDENDRALAERDTDGFIKVVATKAGRILGVTIVGAHAGDLLSPWILAMKKGLRMSAVADLLIPYPTRSEISKKVAGSFFAPRLFGERTKKIVKYSMWLREKFQKLRPKINKVMKKVSIVEKAAGKQAKVVQKTLKPHVEEAMKVADALQHKITDEAKKLQPHMKKALRAAGELQHKVEDEAKKLQPHMKKVLRAAGELQHKVEDEAKKLQPHMKKALRAAGELQHKMGDEAKKLQPYMKKALKTAEGLPHKVAVEAKKLQPHMKKAMKVAGDLPHKVADEAKKLQPHMNKAMKVAGDLPHKVAVEAKKLQPHMKKAMKAAGHLQDKAVEEAKKLQPVVKKMQKSAAGFQKKVGKEAAKLQKDLGKITKDVVDKATELTTAKTTKGVKKKVAPKARKKKSSPKKPKPKK